MNKTKQEIETQLRLLRERTGLNLKTDENSTYGGYELVEVEEPMGGERDVSYYRMGKQDYYTMLYAMNKLLERMEQVKKVSA